MTNTWTVYFVDYAEAFDKRVGSPAEIKQIVDSWKDFGCFVKELKPGVWCVQV